MTPNRGEMIIPAKRNGPISYLKVNQRVWEAALEIAKQHRIRLDSTNVINPTRVEFYITGGTQG